MEKLHKDWKRPPCSKNYGFGTILNVLICLYLKEFIQWLVEWWIRFQIEIWLENYQQLLASATRGIKHPSIAIVETHRSCLYWTLWKRDLTRWYTKPNDDTFIRKLYPKQKIVNLWVEVNCCRFLQSKKGKSNQTRFEESKTVGDLIKCNQAHCKW